IVDHLIAGHRPLDVAGAEPVITDEGNDEPGDDYQRAQREDHPPPGDTRQPGAPVAGLWTRDRGFGHTWLCLVVGCPAPADSMQRTRYWNYRVRPGDHQADKGARDRIAVNGG